MRIFFYSFLSMCLLTSIGCETPNSKTSQKESISINKDLAKVPSAWIQERVKKAETRLAKSKAGEIVWQAMQAHGGLDNWYENGPVSFHFNYQPLEKGAARNTYQVIDTWSSKARHKDASDSSAQFGWDGKQAWVIAKDSTTFQYDLRFWALTPFFFSAQPFVLDGDGTNLQLLEQKKYKETLHDVVKVTFDAGTGDAPDDYYILYFNSQTHKLAVIRYIVSYPAYFPKGKHTPEKFMELTGEQSVAGIHFPTGYRTYMLTEDEMPGKYVTEVTLSEIEFLPETRTDYFAPPQGAKILDNL